MSARSRDDARFVFIAHFLAAFFSRRPSPSSFCHPYVSSISSFHVPLAFGDADRFAAISFARRASKSGNDRKSAPTPARNSRCERCTAENWSASHRDTMQLYPGVVGIKNLTLYAGETAISGTRSRSRAYFWQPGRCSMRFAFTSCYVLF